MSGSADEAAKILAAVLCGGKSLRMGRPKSELDHPAGGNYLQYALARSLRCCDDVVVCVALGAAVLRRFASTPDHPTAAEQGEQDMQDMMGACKVLPDRVADRGPAEGVAVAVGEAQSRGDAGCLITPVDLPHLTSDDLRRLIGAWHEQPDSIIVAVDSRGTMQPLVALYPVRLAAALDQLAGSSHRSLSRFLSNQPTVAVKLDDGSLRNVNTPEDYDR